MDVCGFPKTGYYIRQAYWIEDRPILQLVPHWNWPDKQGELIKVMAITNADSVALSLNGTPLGVKKVDRYDMVSWDVPYEPGILEAVGMRRGEQVAECVVATTGPPVALELLADRTTMSGDGRDAQPITVRAVDSRGRPVPDANLLAKFELTGPGRIIGLGNGNPNCHEPEQGNSRSLFNGLAQVIIQSKRDAHGEIYLRATADELAEAAIEVAVTPAETEPAVPAVRPDFAITQWRMSPLMERPRNPNWRDSDPNDLAWSTIQPGRLHEFRDENFAVYRARFRPNSAVSKQGGKLVFNDMVGKAQIWIDGELVAEKTDTNKQSLSVKLLSGEADRDIAVLFEAKPGSKAGIGGPVFVK
jgi:beta-galactosidase